MGFINNFEIIKVENPFDRIILDFSISLFSGDIRI